MAKQDKTYHIVNPHGTIHLVDHEHAKMRLKQAGWRLATKAEIDALKKAKGEQTFDNPIAAPWKPEVIDEPQPESAE